MTIEQNNYIEYKKLQRYKVCCLGYVEGGVGIQGATTVCEVSDETQDVC